MDVENNLHRAIIGFGKRNPRFLAESRPGLEPEHIWKAMDTYDFLKGTRTLKATPLMAAVHNACLVLVKYLVDEGADVNEEMTSGVGPLSYALMKKNFYIADFFIEAGADVNRVDVDGIPPMYFAIQCGSPVATVKKLISAGAPKDGFVDSAGTRPITRAVAERNVPVVKYLLDIFVDVNYPITEKDLTPLSLSLNQKTFEITELLVRHGANVEGQPVESTAPLISSLLSVDDIRFLQVLIDAGADVNRVFEIKNKNLCNDLKIDEAFLTALQFAVYLGYTPAIQELLRAGADVNAATPFTHRTALHLACLTDSRWTEGGCERSHRTMIRTLIDNGADVFQKDVTNCSPVKCCYVTKNFTAMKELIKAGIDVNENLGGVGSILMYSAMVLRSDVTKLCLEHGGDSFLEFRGINAYQLSYNQYDIQPSRVFFKYHPVDDIPAWNTQGVYPQMYDNQFKFFDAIKNDDEDAVKLSIENGAEARAFLKDMQHPIFLPVVNRNLSILKILLSRGVSPNVCDEDKATPLHDACQNGFLAGCYELLRHGACYSSKTSRGQSSLSIAKSSSVKNQKIVQLLRNIHRLFRLARKGDLNAVKAVLEAAVPDEEFFSYINCVNRKGNSLMGEALSSGFTNVAEIIMSQRVNRDNKEELELL